MNELIAPLILCYLLLVIALIVFMNILSRHTAILTPVYLRDLLYENQENIRESKDYNNLLHIAEIEGKDIIVGYYLDIKEFKIVE